MAAAMYEFDLCTQHVRHTLRVENREETYRLLLAWGGLRMPVESALGIKPGESTTVGLGAGRSSTVRRLTGREI